ncbi:MAG: ribonuclease P protein component [Opitutaceae bacterium]
MRFRPEQHLRRPGDFRTVREQGRRIECGAFTIWFFRRATQPTSKEVTRVGVVASIANVGAAVERNRAKRRLRAVFRLHQGLVPAGSDLILVARAAVNRLDYPALEQKFVDACRKFPTSVHV